MKRIFVVAAALVLTAAFSDGVSAQKKSNALCTMDGCIANCTAKGGQPRHCPAYCTKRIQERQAAKQC